MADLYCERLGPGLWAEPLNAVTNLAFLVAAWVCLSIVRRSPNRSGEVTILIALIAVIGIGSGLFHTLATTWARVLDVVSILLFQTWYIWVYARSIILMNWRWSALLTTGFLVATLIGRQFPAVLNGSLAYAPALFALVSLGIYHYWTKKRGPRMLLLASGVFLLALTFRTIDQAVCPYLWIGTHFLWHLLDAAVLFLVTLAFVLNRGSPSGDSLIDNHADVAHD
ncbi:MAG TPA: ceramidase domain-containing protein [Burkholderiales bacterium]|jgi:Ceramidase|nr:ceramidase domain-containing protein [Burkholderiales bacterium]